MDDCHQGDVTVDRKCDILRGGVKDIRKACQLVGRCDGVTNHLLACSLGLISDATGFVPLV